MGFIYFHLFGAMGEHKMKISKDVHEIVFGVNRVEIFKFKILNLKQLGYGRLFDKKSVKIHNFVYIVMVEYSLIDRVRQVESGAPCGVPVVMPRPTLLIIHNPASAILY